MIYFDNAATTIVKPDGVAKAVYDAINSMGNAARGAHEASLSSMRIISETRAQIGELFHFPWTERVAFTMNATESLNTVISGLFLPGDHVITTACEHNSVLRPLYRMEADGVKLTIVPADGLGNIDYTQLEQAITPVTKAVVCTHASNVTGNVLDIDRIGGLCKKHNILFVLDASQTGGVIPIDMNRSNISVLCFTGHKGLLGPQGTGGICVAPSVTIRPLKVGGSGFKSFDKVHPEAMPSALEAGTLNAHGISGLQVSTRYLLDKGVGNLREIENTLWKRFYYGVKDLPGIKIYGDYSTEDRVPIVTLNLGEYDSGVVSDQLQERFDIATRPGAHCAPLMHQALHTVEQGAVRFSFSHTNTIEEIDKGIEALRILATE